METADFLVGNASPSSTAIRILRGAVPTSEAKYSAAGNIVEINNEILDPLGQADNVQTPWRRAGISLDKYRAPNSSSHRGWATWQVDLKDTQDRKECQEHGEPSALVVSSSLKRGCLTIKAFAASLPR